MRLGLWVLLCFQIRQEAFGAAGACSRPACVVRERLRLGICHWLTVEHFDLSWPANDDCNLHGIFR